MTLQLVVSVDVEEDNWLPTRDRLSTENVRELSSLAVLFQRLGIRATYLTAYQVAIRPWAAALVRDIAAGGRAEVGSHLHPWNTPPFDEQPRHYSVLKHYSPETQLAKLRRLTEAVQEAFSMRPTSFRAGRFGLGRDTVQALIQCRYEVDSSVTPFISWAEHDNGPDFLGAPVCAYTLDGRTDIRVPARHGPIVELPITVGYTGVPLDRWQELARVFRMRAVSRLHLPGLAARLGLTRRVILSPETNSVEDMLSVSGRVLEGGGTQLHVFLHSTSLRPGLGPFTASRADVGRLYRALERYVEGLVRMGSPSFVTLTEAAHSAAPSTPRPSGPSPSGGSASAAESSRYTPAARAPSVSAPPMSSTPWRLLVINYHFPPESSAGGLRWAGLSKYLVRLGWEVHCLTAASGAQVGTNEGVQVHVCPRLRTLNDLYNAVVRRVRTVWTVQGSDSGGAAPPPATIVRQVRREVASVLGLPDEGRGWVLRASARARSLVRRFQPDVVVSSGPPHSAHLVALFATAGGRRPVVIDMRDPWTTDSGPWRDHAVYGTRVARFVIARLERLCFQAASLVIANTREFADALVRSHPGLRVACVPNGVDPERLPPPARERLPGLAVACVGTLYGARDVGPVLTAFRLFLEQCPGAAAAGSRLRVAGHRDPGPAARLRDQIIESGIGAAVEVLDVLPTPQALDLVSRSHVAVVLAQGQPLQVPSKLYEAVGMQVATLVIGESGGATAREGRRIGAITKEPDDINGICEVFKQVWAGQAPSDGSPTDVFHYTRIAEVLDRLLRDGMSADSRNLSGEQGR